MTLCYHTSVDLVNEGELQMRVRFVSFVIIFFSALVLITGCGEEDITVPEEEIDEPEDPCIPKVPPNTAIPFHITPADGTTISLSQEFTLDFDMVVIEVTVNGISATGSGRTWVVSLILEPGRGISLSLLSGQKAMAALGGKPLAPTRLLPTKTRLNADGRATDVKLTVKCRSALH